jgi:hypothetical protein
MGPVNLVTRAGGSIANMRTGDEHRIAGQECAATSGLSRHWFPPGRYCEVFLRQRRSKTMRAFTWPFSTCSKHSLTSSSLRVSRITLVRP